MSEQLREILEALWNDCEDAYSFYRANGNRDSLDESRENEVSAAITKINALRTHPAEALPEHVAETITESMSMAFAAGIAKNPELLEEEIKKLQAIMHTTPDATRVPDEIIQWVQTDPSERGIAIGDWNLGYRTAWATVLGLFEKYNLLSATPPSGAVGDHIGGANKMAEVTGNIIIAGDHIYAGIDEEQDAISKISNAFVVEFKSADDMRAALRDRTINLTLFEVTP